MKDISSQPKLSPQRRKLLKTLGFSAGLLSVNGCSGITKSLGSKNYNRPHSRGPFIAPRISKDKIVRVIVGLRPYRPSGFVVKLEEYDNKNIIHNYGHGGGGISLSWGSSALAVQKAVSLPVNNAAVIGSGIMGLTTARLLQDKGWNVTIYTRDLSRHSVSNVGAGQWAPTGVFEEGKATKAFEEQYKYAARISHHAYQNLSGANYGIRFVENYYLRNELGFITDIKYNVFGPVHPWDNENDNTRENLRKAMAQNPFLKVFIQSGYYDGATNYFQAKYTMWQIDPSGKMKDRLYFEGYRSGHMMYLREEDLEKSNDDLRQFLKNSSTNGKPAKY